MNRRHLIHLSHRASFGMSPKLLSALELKSKDEVISEIFKDASNFFPIHIDLSEFKVLKQPKAKQRLGETTFRELAKKGRQKTKELNYLWLERLASNESLLREKMTLFWANVFVCKDNAIWHILPYNNLLREHALGNFGDFVKAVAKSPSMSKYLNNRQNRKESPNENFARELMELFTLGIGNYTEKDIKESARAFTGWSFDRNGDFFLRPRHHDYGEKTFLGQTGNFNGDDIIDIILEQKQCARFICDKVYRYFVNPEVNETHLEELTNVFYEDYDIERLMRHLLMTDWFYAEENIGSKIKSPVELLVGIYKTVPIQFQKKKQLLFLQRMMGQTLLDPPNVAGWKGDKSWIDSNTLMFRMNLPAILLNNAVIEYAQKGEFEDSFEAYYEKEQRRKRILKVVVDWEQFNNDYKGISAKEMKALLLPARLDADTKTFLYNLKTKDLKTRCIQLMSLPEYQLC